MNQRWRMGRTSYRVPDEVINPQDYEVAALRGEREAKEFIRTHHYLKSTPPSRWRFGLFRHGMLAGVAVFSHLMNDRSITNVFRIPVTEGVELGRLVLLDDVPGNGESFFVARCFHNLKGEGIAGVVSFADPVVRTALDGSLIAPGHIGTVYKALSGAYLGRSQPRTLRVLPDGHVLSERTLQKLRAGERGTHAIRETLLNLGAPEEAFANAAAVGRAVEQFTRPLRHGGVHKYAWGFTAAVRKQMPPGLPYPEMAPLFCNIVPAT